MPLIIFPAKELSVIPVAVFDFMLTKRDMVA
jgi:hypothetical protein